VSETNVARPEVETLILEHERRRIRAMVDKDLATLEELLADDLSYVHSGGRNDNKRAFIELIARPTTHYLDVTYTSCEFVGCGEDAAVLRGIARLTLRRAEPVDIIYSVLFSVVYRKRNDKWQLVVWHATRAPE
jgi:hypothetical protein